MSPISQVTTHFSMHSRSPKISFMFNNKTHYLYIVHFLMMQETKFQNPDCSIPIPSNTSEIQG